MDKPKLRLIQGGRSIPKPDPYHDILHEWTEGFLKGFVEGMDPGLKTFLSCSLALKKDLDELIEKDSGPQKPAN